jgi:predicted RNA-binding protein associated with RNAse of E/G family
MPPGPAGVFDTGRAIVRRDVYRGKIVSAWLGRVVHDHGDGLAWALFSGVEMLSRASYVEKLRTGDKSHGLGELATGGWTLASAPLQRTTILAFQLPDTYFSVMVFFRESGELGKWYVNFERPYRRTAIGFDTSDLLLDLVIEPDGTCRWKDEDEYQQGRRLGIVDVTDHAEVEKAREQALGMFARRIGPFEERWVSWRHDPNWTIPTLPANATSLPTRY